MGPSVQPKSPDDSVGTVAAARFIAMSPLPPAFARLRELERLRHTKEWGLSFSEAHEYNGLCLTRAPRLLDALEIAVEALEAIHSSTLTGRGGSAKTTVAERALARIGEVGRE